jgi:hypothetical protein
MKYEFYMTANLEFVKETKKLRQEVASVIPLPPLTERQPDLAYFTSRFVSSGTNLNYAHFMGSELVKARKTIVAKAVDVEHEESEIIGHIYACEYTDKEGIKLNIEELTGHEEAKLDAQDMHIEIASVVYKTRFPVLAKEIKENKWCVSMEAYYTSFDILVGNTLLTLEEAQLMGFDISNEALYGKAAKIIKSGMVIDEGTVAKVLRGICFSGVGIVKNPANKPSIVFEATAGIDEQPIEFNLNKLEKADNNVTSSNIDINTTDDKKTAAQDSPGVCVSFIREGVNSLFKDQDSKVINTNWCNKFDTSCPVTGDFTNAECLAKVNETQLDIQYVIEVSNNKIKELQKDQEIDRLITLIESLL